MFRKNVSKSSLEKTVTNGPDRNGDWPAGTAGVTVIEGDDYSFLKPDMDLESYITLTAQADQVWSLDSVSFSFSAAPTKSAWLTVTIGGQLRFSQYVTGGGLGFVTFRTAVDEGLYGDKNEDVTVALSAGGANIYGVLTLKYR